MASSLQPTPTVPVTAPKGQTSNIAAPILGGAVGGFLFTIGMVAITLFIRKKCRKSNAVTIEEEDIVIPYPVTRGRNRSKQPDLANESRPHESGFLGRSMQMTGHGSSPL